MSISLLILSLLLASVPELTAVSDDPINGAPSDETVLERLRDGEVVVENARTDESGGAVRVQVLMHAARQDVWDYIANCDHVYRYVDGLRKCELLDTEVQGDVDISKIEQTLKKSWLTPKMDYIIQVRRQPPSRVDFELVSGDMDTMEGGWRFVDTADGLLVTHEIRVRPSLPVPRWLVRRSMRKAIELQVSGG